MHRCKAHGKRWCTTCVLATLAFPIEHVIWERSPLRVVLPWLGLG
jgi:hypothetical protein